MILADRIQDFVLNKYIEPARNWGDLTVRMRAGDVHLAMELQNRKPAVCSGLNAEKFSDYARVQLVQRDDPHQGTNAEWVFTIK